MTKKENWDDNFVDEEEDVFDASDAMKLTLKFKTYTLDRVIGLIQRRSNRGYSDYILSDKFLTTETIDELNKRGFRVETFNRYESNGQPYIDYRIRWWKKKIKKSTKWLWDYFLFGINNHLYSN